MALAMAFQSPSVSLPLRTFLESTRASEQRIRWLSSTLLISSEKNSTGLWAFMAAWVAMPRANDVLPMAAGRHHHERAGLQTRRHLVEVDVAGGCPVIELPRSYSSSSRSRLSLRRS